MMHIKSVAQINDMICNEKLKHPLIMFLEPSKFKEIPKIEQQITIDLFSINLKTDKDCHMKYGSQTYDFKEGSIICMAPGQTIEPLSKSENHKTHGWNLIFHPDLIHNTELGKKIDEYTFFHYDSHEALHLSHKEKEIITSIAKAIEYEYSQNIDDFSQKLIVTNIELLLNHCMRFYRRQFNTRTRQNKDVVSRFESLLKKYFISNMTKLNGLPSVSYLASELGYSPNYLSDLLKKETGKNTQEHIHYYLIEKAKYKLLGSEDSVNQIAYSLGFKHPQHFSVLFKKKTGVSPIKFRQ